jgi:hypothetical protein
MLTDSYPPVDSRLIAELGEIVGADGVPFARPSSRSMSATAGR